ncbi:MATE family efflux transporter [uncultured Ilyobacter sp.]|uniref:MATE family efflux transporter n=1 Tax=uncultured Ilyobacter sp. TaxID=544433 RepID=UPI0029BFB532|nr:MATE family efflux transporter [uncultured Ilyobacter sp.]
MEKIKRLGEEKINKLLIEFSLPAIISSLVFALYNVVDRMFIGKCLGPYAMAGISITFPIFTIYIAVGMLVGHGGGSIVSLRLGQGRKEEADRVLGNVFTLYGVFSIILMTLGYLLMDRLMIIFGATENTIIYAKDYLYIINFLVLFDFVAMGVNNLLRSEGNPKFSMIIMIVGALTNVFLDFIFIFVLDYGIKGAAMATAIANIVGSIMVLYHFIYSDRSNIKLKLKYLKPDFKIIKEIFSIGISPFTLQLANSLVAVFANRALLIYGGDMAVGAMGAINSVFMFLMMTLSGIIQGAQPLLGYNYGAQKYDRVKKILNMALLYGMIISLVLTASIMITPEFFINLFNNGNHELLEIGKKGIRIFMALVVFNAIYVVGANYFQAVGQANKSLFLNIFKQIGLFIPFIIILPKYFGLNGIWFAAPVSDIIIFIITGIFLLKNNKKLKKLSVQYA